MSNTKIKFLKKKLEEVSGKKVVLKEQFLESSDDIEKFVGFLLPKSKVQDSLNELISDIFKQDLNAESNSIKIGVLKALSPIIEELVREHSRDLNR